MKSRTTSSVLLASVLFLAACRSSESAGAEDSSTNSRVHLGMAELEFLSVFHEPRVVGEGADWKTYRVEVEKLDAWGERGGGFVTATRAHETDFVFRDGRLVEYRSVR